MLVKNLKLLPSNASISCEGSLRESPPSVTIAENEGLDLLNQGRFDFTNPGPLHTPILGFSIHRDDSLALILETEIAPDAKSTAVRYPSGTVRINTDQAELVAAAGLQAVLTGVQTLTVKLLNDNLHKEVARVHQLTVTRGDLGKAVYTIEWLDNLPASPFIWPNSIHTKKGATGTSRIVLADDRIMLFSPSLPDGVSQSCAKLMVAEQTLYVCAQSRESVGGGLGSGFIVYVGIPDDILRKKIRIALSFALGTCLTELGHALYDKEWNIVSVTSRSTYNLSKRIFDPAPMPLAPLSNRSFRYDLCRAELTRIVNALVAEYEKLDLGILSWAYWHACAATVHIAPAHFGAAIETLQRAYIKGRRGAIKTRILDRPQWDKLQEAIACVIANFQAAEESKRALSDNLRNVNQVPQRAALKAVLRAIGIKLGADEDDAWKRRNSGAHGLPIPEGDELGAIRDMKLLRGLFHRMLLRISNASDFYVDYVSLDHHRGSRGSRAL